MDRDRRLCELMGWKQAEGPWINEAGDPYEAISINTIFYLTPPDFDNPRNKGILMDWAVEQEWWDGFVEKQKSIFLGKWVRGEIDGKPWVNPESEFITYLWRNFADLIVEYHGEGRE